MFDLTYDLAKGILIGILIGAGVFGHVWRMVALKESGASGDFGRMFVAAAAVFLYTLASLLVFLDSALGYGIAVLGPCAGVTAIFLIPGEKVDALQITLGVPQIMGSAIAFGILITYHLPRC